MVAGALSVARRRKHAARDAEEGIPSPPGSSAIAIKFSGKQKASHYLYVREQSSRRHQVFLASEEALFVLNVPLSALRSAWPASPPWPRPGRGIAGTARARREPQGALSRASGGLRGAPEAEWGGGGLSPEGPLLVSAQSPREERPSQVIGDCTDPVLGPGPCEWQ